MVITSSHLSCPAHGATLNERSKTHSTLMKSGASTAQYHRVRQLGSPRSFFNDEVVAITLVRNGRHGGSLEFFSYFLSVASGLSYDFRNCISIDRSLPLCVLRRPLTACNSFVEGGDGTNGQGITPEGDGGKGITHCAPAQINANCIDDKTKPPSDEAVKSEQGRRIRVSKGIC